MTDWKPYVRTHLPHLDIRAEREAEIIDELALQLEAAYDAAVAGARPRMRPINRLSTRCPIGRHSRTT